LSPVIYTDIDVRINPMPNQKWIHKNVITPVQILGKNKYRVIPMRSKYVTGIANKSCRTKGSSITDLIDNIIGARRHEQRTRNGL
jgi:hypothetical protein